ncbi:MAG: extracellular solute-binding protein, partial [Oscillospiraceae bacterium]|nr:extracellular solute-binding protein [Oscillospiraceae bacterium]
MKKTLGIILCVALAATVLISVLVACSNNKTDDPKTDDKKITVITREESSGTRSAFIELFGVEEKDAGGKKVDNTIDTAETATNTAGVLMSIVGNKDAIGYISLGSLNDTVSALSIEGIAPSVATVKDGTYPIQRPFNIITKAELSAVAKDFVDFILSAEGQAVVQSNNYIPLDNAPAFASNKPAGTVKIDGSSSVGPLMEKLGEAYEKLNTGAKVEVNVSDSGTGITSAVEGRCDFGMSSRDLKDEETAGGAKQTKIATDGIVVIVNKNRPITNATKD